MKIYAEIKKTLLVAACATIPAFAAADGWNLPADLNDTNTKINFEVDSTWHLVRGNTAGIFGRAWLEREGDLSSLRAELKLPVSRFDTDGSSRDKKMRKVMHADAFPEVAFIADGASSNCSEQDLSGAQPCTAEITGRLTISGRTAALKVSADLNPSAGKLRVSGSLPIAWADYGVEDPSILVAKLDPVATVRFEVLLDSPSAPKER